MVDIEEQADEEQQMGGEEAEEQMGGEEAEEQQDGGEQQEEFGEEEAHSGWADYGAVLETD